MLILFCCYLQFVVSRLIIPFSFTVRDNKLYVIYQAFGTEYIEFKVYKLKDGSVSDIVNSVKTRIFDLEFIGFRLEFIDIPDSSLDSHNKLWVRAGIDPFLGETKNTTYHNWVGYINLNDMSFKTDPSFIKFPTYDSFPKDLYTVNHIENEFGSALYITGGRMYTKNRANYTIGNSFFKYDFTKREWIDMAYLANGKLKPLVDHKSVIVGNRYLVMLGGVTRNNLNETKSLDNSTYYNSLYNLTVFDTFNNNWDVINVKPNIFDINISTLQFNEFLATVYNNKIIVIGVVVGEGNTFFDGLDPYIGILDYSSKTWSWSQIYDEDGNIYKSRIRARDIFLYNDQLIIYCDTQDQLPIKVYDMSSNRMKYTLRSPNISDTANIIYSAKAIPNYAAALIALSCTVLLLALVYLLYSKIKKSKLKTPNTKYNGPIREVWSNPDMDIAFDIISRGKSKSCTVKKNTSIVLYPNSSNQNTSNILEFD